MASTELTVRLPPDLAEQLQVLATASNHSVDDIVLAQLRAALALGRPAEQPAAGAAGSPRLLDRKDSEKLHFTASLSLDRSGRVSLYRPSSSGSGGGSAAGADGGGSAAAARSPTDALYRSESAAMYLSAPIISLVEGLLTDETTVGQALRHGDFGLGTLNKLDGELVVLDGVVYQQAASGACRVVQPDEKTPFMSLTFWKPEKAQQVQLEMPASGPLQHPSLCRQLEGWLPSGNIFYAMRVHGRFRRLKLRSVRKQQVDRPLRRVAEDQAEFEIGETSGTLIGFWSPLFVGFSLTLPGFHFHFLSDDKQRGGHVLESELLEGEAWVQPLYNLASGMPHTEAWRGADLSKDPAADLQAAE